MVNYTEVLSEDGSYTAYSNEYGEHYHSTKDGALKESLVKHVIPAFNVVQTQDVHILDICTAWVLTPLQLFFTTKNIHPKQNFTYILQN